jgi:hypothetical protein
MKVVITDFVVGDCDLSGTLGEEVSRVQLAEGEPEVNLASAKLFKQLKPKKVFFVRPN